MNQYFSPEQNQRDENERRSWMSKLLARLRASRAAKIKAGWDKKKIGTEYAPGFTRDDIVKVSQPTRRRDSSKAEKNLIRIFLYDVDHPQELEVIPSQLNFLETEELIFWLTKRMEFEAGTQVGRIVGIDGHPMSGLWQIRFDTGDMALIESGHGMRQLARAFNINEGRDGIAAFYGRMIRYTKDSFGVLEGFDKVDEEV
jgi:hypothetical protein